MKPIVKCLMFLLLTLTCLTARAQQTYSISGAVTDDKGQPLPGTTVFITNSKYATATNDKGEFTLSNIQPGTYEVVSKMLGFDASVQNVIVKGNSVKIAVRLTETSKMLNTVEITSSPDPDEITGGPGPNRSRWLDLFITNFIGQTVNSEKCKLLNPDVLKFHLDKQKNILYASADDFLVVENKALGYKIRYLLTEFKIDFDHHTYVYSGYPYFEEMEGSASQKQKWQANRQLAYLSSNRHFYKALVENKLEKEGFLVYVVTKLLYTDNPLKFKGWTVRLATDEQKMMMHTAIPLSETGSEFIFGQNGSKAVISTPKSTVDTLEELYIVYTGEKESALFYKTRQPIDLLPFINLAQKEKSRRQISVITPLADTIMIDRNGGLVPVKGFLYKGYWGWQRIADLTPLDYFGVADTARQAEVPEAKTVPEVAANPELRNIIAATDTLRSRLPVEKLYIQTDKPDYTIGDTIRFKAYLLNADFLTPSARSRILYIELDNAGNQSVKQLMVPVVSGVSWGDIALDAETIPEGSYTIRAYTNWMRNFGEDDVFKKSIYISPVSGNPVLVNTNFKLDSVAGRDTLQTALSFTRLDKDPLRVTDMQLRLINDRHSLYKYTANTGVDGSIHVNFDLTNKRISKNLFIQAQQRGRNADTAILTIPIILNRPENTDLQFMPEGGNLIAGIKTRIGFKAIGEDGRGTHISGKICNSKRLTIAAFASAYRGIGSFELTPQAGESYTAEVTMPNKTVKAYPLPAVSPSGTSLRITKQDNDSLTVALSASPDLINTNTPYYIIGQARGVVCYAATVRFKGNAINKYIDRNIFPDGITRFTLLSENLQPLNERIVYINHYDNLNINVTSSKSSYATRDSVALSISVNDKDGKPVQGNFSLAVTDDGQVKNDSLTANILTSLLLTSDLKGTVEGPAYYLEGTPASQKALDNLLLTQGWVGYNWQQVFNSKMQQPQYPAEKEFVITGKLTNLFNRPLKNAPVLMMQKKPLLIMDTLTDNKGRFTFKSSKLFPTDSAYYLIEAKDKDGENKNFNVGVDVDEFVPMKFKPSRERVLPWYMNTDMALLNNANAKAAQRIAEANYEAKGHLLREVVIKDKIHIPGSVNPYPDLDTAVLDQKYMDAAKKKTLLEVLEGRFKNFQYYSIGFGIWIFRFNNWGGALRIDGRPGYPLDFYMNYLTAEDIRGIEVRYEVVRGADVAFTYVTTYSGNGKYIKHNPGTYVYKPLGFSLPKQFYSPRYTVKDAGTAIGTDLRSTIYWEPNLITDSNGNATVSFFSADQPGAYTLIIEGTDLNGNLGYQKQKIQILKPTNK